MKFRLGTPIYWKNFPPPVPVKDEPKEIIYKTKAERIGDILISLFYSAIIVSLVIVGLALISMLTLLGVAILTKMGVGALLIYLVFLLGTYGLVLNNNK